MTKQLCSTVHYSMSTRRHFSYHIPQRLLTLNTGISGHIALSKYIATQARTYFSLYFCVTWRPLHGMILHPSSCITWLSKDSENLYNRKDQLVVPFGIK